MEKSAEVKSADLRFFDAITSGDVGSMDRSFSRQDGVLLIGTDPDEWWSGYDKIMSIWRAQFEAVGGSFPTRPSDPQAYSEGNVGWFADRPVFILPDGTEMPFRVTAVLHKENGEWKMVQAHVSFGVPNEEAIGQELPT